MEGIGRKEEGKKRRVKGLEKGEREKYKSEEKERKENNE